MRLDTASFLLIAVSSAVCDGFLPLFRKINVRKSDQAVNLTTEDPDVYSSYDPFDKDEIQNHSDDSFFSDLTNSSKRIKIQLETAQFIQKFGAQHLLNTILHKVQTANIPHNSKEAISDFLDFVEDLIYRNSVKRIEEKLQLELEKSPDSEMYKVHMGETSNSVLKKKLKYGDTKDNRRRDAPALSPSAIHIEEDENYPAVIQPLEPTKMMFLSHSEPNFHRDELMIGREIRRAPMKQKTKSSPTKSEFEKAIQRAEREAEMEKILKKRRALLAEKRRLRKQREWALKMKKSSRKRSLLNIQEINSVRRSPVRRSTFNEKMFQLLQEYGIKSFTVETADYSVRVSANPEKTRFSSVNSLDAPVLNDALGRSPARLPSDYSRAIHAPNRNPTLQSHSTKKRLFEKKRKGINLDRLL